MADTDPADEIARLERMVAEQGRRTRGAFAAIRSIARRSARPGLAPEDYVDRLSGRLAALARAEARIAAEPLVDLELLLADELLAHAARIGEQAVLSGPSVALEARAAQLLALAAHELASNAVQFGALGGEDGRVTIAWSREGDAPLRLEWRERMTEPPAELGPSGFGMDLLTRRLAYELGAETEIGMTPEGLRCVIATPLPATS